MNADLTKEQLQAELQRLYEDVFAAGLKVDATVITNGQLMPVEHWVNLVRDSSFIDYDGHGHFAMRRVDNRWLLSNISVRPSAITRFNIQPPAWATHVIWYNR